MHQVVLLVLTLCIVLLTVASCFKFIPSRIGVFLRRNSKRTRKILLKNVESTNARAILVGFFHPYCNAGGGGERVLWAAVRCTLEESVNAFCVIYTGDLDVDKQDIILRVKNAFGIDLDYKRIAIVHLRKRYLVSPETWPRFTLIGQSLGSLPLAYEALSALVPDIFVDTMGYAFTYPLVSLLLNIPVVTYTHYPTISTDMLSSLPNSRTFKLFYWRIFAKLYMWAGRYADVVMVNSTWTRNHIQSLWHCSEKLSIVYPPCDTTQLSRLSVDDERRKEIVCVAQFRKEKDHETLLRAFQQLVDEIDPRLRDQGIKMILIGTVRNDSDRARVDYLESLARSLNIADCVEFRLDLPWPEVIKTLGFAWIGANAMWNEHFGIGVVEYLAAGLIPVVHDSAGPKLDIVTEYDSQKTGFHATSVESFAKSFADALHLGMEECKKMRRRAQKSAARFSEEVFKDQWNKTMAMVYREERKRYMARGIKV